MKRSQFIFAACTLWCFGQIGTAHAQSTIRHPGQRPHYDFELEPHLLLGAFDPPGPAHGGDGLGLGFRGTIEVAPEGFISKLNDSVGVGFGMDWVHYSTSAARGRCSRFIDGPNGTLICAEVDTQYSRDYFYVPIVMQWNFWLARRWSVFGEPGLSLNFPRHRDMSISPALYAGGRFHFSDQVTLTMRLGYPTFSLGVSFLL
ncbi:MAG TPA: hypothetical protein VFQ61_17035 [Polyangiaceae bacterium]|nr:hypothetical protein [Polyangiaceae bacterium]